MKKIAIITMILIASLDFASAQQLGQYDQFNFNGMVHNPAFTGMEHFTDVRANFRRQWVGFDNAPRSFYLGASSRIMKNTVVEEKAPPSIFISNNDMYDKLGGKKSKSVPSNHGLGGYVISDRNGPFERLSAFANYAYHLQISDKSTLAFGIGAGFSRREIDLNAIQVLSQNDGIYNNYLMNDDAESHLDIKAGLTFYGENYYVGYSSNQLLQNEIYDIGSDETERLALHHYVSAGYVFDLNDNLELMPSALVRYVEPAPIVADFNVRLRIDQEVWFGLGYRTDDAVNAQIGLTLNEKLNFGYSYAYSMSEIQEANDGTHEISLGFMFNNSVPAPTKLW